MAVEIRNPEPGPLDPGDADFELPETARSERLYAALAARQAPNDGPWPTQIVRSDDAYAETSLLVVADSLPHALRRAADVAAEALTEAQIDPGPVRLSIGAVHERDGANGGQRAAPGLGAAAPAPAVAPDECYARAWHVDDHLAQGALRRASLQILDELDEAVYDMRHGTPAGETLFVHDHLPPAFARVYDEAFLERFRVCLVVVGYKLGQDPALAPGCLAEEVALEVVRRLAARLIEDVDPEATSREALLGVFEVCGDEEVLDLFAMEERTDAALPGHDPVSRLLGRVDRRLEAWFDPLWEGRTGTVPHPICW